MLITPLFDTVIHHISIIVIKEKTELQLFSIILKNVIKLQLITITILITPTLTWTTGVTAIALCTSCSRAKNVLFIQSQ